jgi:hypothetical protein
MQALACCAVLRAVSTAAAAAVAPQPSSAVHTTKDKKQDEAVNSMSVRTGCSTAALIVCLVVYSTVNGTTAWNACPQPDMHNVTVVQDTQCMGSQV